MSNYVQTKIEVKNYIMARTPLIIINAVERERVERMLSEISNELSSEIFYYTDSKQVISLNSNATGMDADNDPIGFIGNMFKKKRKTTFAFGDVKRISDDTIYSRELINVLYLAKETDSTLILITADTVFQGIAQFGMIAKLDYPDLEERIVLINKFIDMYGRRYTVDWDVDDCTRAATLLKGFTEIQIENILSNEIISEQGLLKKNIFKLTVQKDKLYAAVPSVQSIKVDRTLEVSGLESLKSWLKEKKSIFFSSDDQLNLYDLVPPKGILLSGVPGCGKSFSAKMIAKEWELPLYRFDIGSVYDKWMGESERRMRDALSFVDNVSPCILWVDEIEKALAVSDSGGNDTSQRILGQFLFWLQESKSRVFLVATANDISRLPSELFRKGRFSEIFFVDLPSVDERKTAIIQFSSKCLHIKFTESQLNEMVSISDGFSFSEIEYALKEVAQLLLLYGSEKIDMNVIRKKFNQIIPIEKRNPEVVEKIRNWGAERAVPAN